MNASTKKWRSSCRMIWAIARKDIVEAIQNKTILGILIGVGFMMISTQALSLLVRWQRQPPIVILDQGTSTTIRELVRSRTFRIRLADSQDDLSNLVSQSSEPVLGLVIPANLDDLVDGNDPLELQGFYLHWVKPSKVTALVVYFEEKLSLFFGLPIRIQTVDNLVYPKVDALGYSTMISAGLVLGVFTIGLIMVPILLIEEKETRTLDALLLSPVRIHHLLIGKSLAGLFYATSASVMIFVFSAHWIVHWWVVILAVLLGAFCAVITGLLIGAIFDNITSVNLWTGLIIAFFLLPVFLWSSIAPNLPEFLQTILKFLPSLAMSEMVSLSLVETITFDQVLPNIIAMGAFTLLIFSLVAWNIRRIDR